MTTGFDRAETGGGGEVPVELVTRGGRTVSVLEFLAPSEGETATEGIAPDTAESEASALQMRAMLDAARTEAVTAARESFELEMEARLMQERARVERVCAGFAKDRARYFGAAETQVVKLALAIARRVLAREVAADPMHLTATVRAALARVQDGSSPGLRVRSEDVDEWQAMFSGGGETRVVVSGDDSLAAGECVLETNVGRVELGVEVQMGEIARGFDELLHR